MSKACWTDDFKTGKKHVCKFEMSEGELWGTDRGGEITNPAAGKRAKPG